MYLNPDIPYVVSEQLGRTYSVAKLPYAVLIDERRLIASFGMVNSREHIESLVEAKQRGVGSLQDFLGQQAAAEGAEPALAKEAGDAGSRSA